MITYSKSGEEEGLNNFCFKPIGYVVSPFRDKYGVPRQPSLSIAARGKIKLNHDPDLVTALKTLEQFSHLWIIFVFHQHGGKNWKPSIRPPRLGGRTKVGVLASRSPHRPNPIGMSVVQILDVNLSAQGGPEISVAGLDLIDGTPVLDIKPYISYSDAVSEAASGWAAENIVRYKVTCTGAVEEILFQIEVEKPQFRELMNQVLEIDPRPAYQKRERPIEGNYQVPPNYGIEIDGYEVKYCIGESMIQVMDLYKI